jgi:hypothetical protein
MNIVKLTCPVEWNLDLPGLKTQFHRLTPGLSAAWGDYTFLVNDDTQECDYWLVYGFLEKPETVTVRKNTILLLSEEIGIKKWDDSFMQQFDIVMGSQTNVNHPHYIHDHYVCGWQVQKSYDQLDSIAPVPKTKLLSIIASNMRVTEGHRRRYDFVKQLKEHFTDRVDWYGKGNNFINDKWDGLHDYKFSVAIENQQIENYWTEKIADCFLAYTIPLYYGCTNIDQFFPKGSYVKIDLDNIHKSIETIEELLTGNYYEKNLDAVKEARKLILNKYQLMPMVAGWMDGIGTQMHKSQKVTLYPESNFIKLSLLNKFKNKIQRVFHS